MTTEIIKPNSLIYNQGLFTRGTSDAVDAVQESSDGKYLLRIFPPVVDIDVYVLFGFANPTNVFVSISSVALYADLFAGYIPHWRPRIKTHGIEYTGSLCADEGYQNYATNPYTGVAWTPTEVNDLQAGAGLSDSGVPSGNALDKLWIVVTGDIVVPAPTDAAIRVTGIRHVCRPGSYRLEANLGDLTTTIPVTLTIEDILAHLQSKNLPDIKPAPTVEDTGKKLAIEELIKGIKYEESFSSDIITRTDPRMVQGMGPVIKQVQYNPITQLWEEIRKMNK